MASTITCIPATRNVFTAIPMTSITKRRVAAYARVSTDSDEQFTSYEAQIDYYTKLIRQREDWTYVSMLESVFNGNISRLWRIQSEYFSRRRRWILKRYS